MKLLEKIRGYMRISGVAPISRRYFIMNAFDGAYITEEAEHMRVYEPVHF